MIIILERFKTFWTTFWDSVKKAYNKAYKHPPEMLSQMWRDIENINFLDIFVSKLGNLTNNQASFNVESDSVQTDTIKALCKDLERQRYKICENMIGDGDYYIFPAHNRKGEIIHTYLTQAQVRIVDMDGEDIREAYGIINWLVDSNNRVFYLLRHHKLLDDGTLTISYSAINEQGTKESVEAWKHLDGQAYSFSNANHIGFGRYKSPASSRGMSAIYGVPLNFGCKEIEADIKEDLKLIREEFRNGKSKIFTDLRNLKPDEKTGEYKFAGNIIPINSRAGVSGSNIDIYSPVLRYSEHFAKLMCDLELYEKEVGTSKGILTSNEQTTAATATEVRRANADTLSLVDKIRCAIDSGNQMTLEADAVFLNVAKELWTYSSDWYDPFEDPAEQWNRLVEAKSNGAAEERDLVKWMFPMLSDEAVEDKLKRINDNKKADADKAISSIFAGE